MSKSRLKEDFGKSEFFLHSFQFRGRTHLKKQSLKMRTIVTVKL